MGNYVPKGEESVKFNLGPKKEDPKNEETKKSFEEAYKKQKNNTLIKRIIGIALAGCVTVGSAGALVYKNYKSNHPFEGELLNITNNDEYKELKKEWKNNPTVSARDMLTTPQQLKDDIASLSTLNTWCSEEPDILYLFGIDEDIYMVDWTNCFWSDDATVRQWGYVTSLYKYHVGKDVIKNFKLMGEVSTDGGDDYFNYIYLIKHVLENYKGELMVQNYGNVRELSEVDGDQGTVYSINVYGINREDGEKPTFTKITGTIPDFILSTRIEYRLGMLVGERVDALRDKVVEDMGELEFWGNELGMKYVNYSNEYTK